MALFRYRALTQSGESVEGEMDAADEAAVLERLHDAGQIPVRAEPLADGRRQPRRRGPGFRLDTLTRELARLTAAGLPLERALEIARDIAVTPAAQASLGRLLAGIRGGGALSEALEAEGAPFDRLYIALVRAGEAAGSLPAVLDQLADHLARVRALRGEVVAALTYPAILLAVSLASVLLLLITVVPQFEALFADAGAALPTPTRITFALARTLQAWWVEGLAAFAILLFALSRLQKTEAGGRALDVLLLRLPLLGPLLREIETTRFSRTLGLLVESGVPLLAACEIAEGVLRNRAMAPAVAAAREALKRGERLAIGLSAGDTFPPLAVQMIAAGEETGRLETMLLDVAALYDSDIRQRLRTLLALLEPLLILVLGAVVGGIVLSILVAMLDLNALAV